MQQPKRGGSFAIEKRYVRPDGSAIWVYNSVTALIDQDGRPSSVMCVCLEISERKAAEEQRRTLIGELNHRVKNVLTVVQSVAHQTIGQATSLQQARAALDDRLAALGRVHDAITASNAQHVYLEDLAAQALAPFCSSPRCSIDGDQVAIPARMATSFSLALHELATNAVKYGALKNESGQVIVRWTCNSDELEFVWREVGGPEVTPPDGRGFGTRMIERALAGDLNGTARVDFLPEGIVCTIKAPLP